MTPNYRGARIIDGDGNVYAFQCSLDTNINSVEDIILSTQQGISKYVGYKLVIDGVYKNTEDQRLENQATFNFYKKIELNSEDQKVTHEEFGTAMKEIIEKARISKINQVRFKSFRGEEVFQDGRGYFLKRVLGCGIPECENKIPGTIRLSLDTDGAISRPQSFTPDDKKVQKARKGSKSWLCPTCSVKSIEIPKVVEEAKVIEPEPGLTVEEKVKVKPKVLGKKEKIMKRLSELSSEDKDVSAEYIKGYLSAALEVLQDTD